MLLLAGALFQPHSAALLAPAVAPATAARASCPIMVLDAYGQQVRPPSSELDFWSAERGGVPAVEGGGFEWAAPKNTRGRYDDIIDLEPQPPMQAPQQASARPSQRVNTERRASTSFFPTRPQKYDEREADAYLRANSGGGPRRMPRSAEDIGPADGLNNDWAMQKKKTKGANRDSANSMTPSAAPLTAGAAARSRAKAARDAEAAALLQKTGRAPPVHRGGPPVAANNWAMQNSNTASVMAAGALGGGEVSQEGMGFDWAMPKPQTNRGRYEMQPHPPKPPPQQQRAQVPPPGGGGRYQSQYGQPPQYGQRPPQYGQGMYNGGQGTYGPGANAYPEQAQGLAANNWALDERIRQQPGGGLQGSYGAPREQPRYANSVSPHAAVRARNMAMRGGAAGHDQMGRVPSHYANSGSVAAQVRASRGGPEGVGEGAAADGVSFSWAVPVQPKRALKQDDPIEAARARHESAVAAREPEPPLADRSRQEVSPETPKGLLDSVLALSMAVEGKERLVGGLVATVCRLEFKLFGEVLDGPLNERVGALQGATAMD